MTEANQQTEEAQRAKWDQRPNIHAHLLGQAIQAA
jgi:hypothetical protein